VRAGARAEVRGGGSRVEVQAGVRAGVRAGARAEVRGGVPTKN
jgi:hypothetical protein